MSKIKLLDSKIKQLKIRMDNRVDNFHKEIDEALKEVDDIDISEVFTAATAPDRIKKLSAKKRDGWIKAFNSSFKKDGDESKAFKIANAAIKNIKENKEKDDKQMNKKAKNLKELLEFSGVAPTGTFEDLRNKVIQEIDALINKVPFVIQFDGDGDPIQRKPFLAYMFPDKIIVEWMESLYQMTFIVDSSMQVTLGEVKKVEQEFSIVEKKELTVPLKDELKESNITITKEAKDMDLELNGFISLKEAKFDEGTGELAEVVLIEAGTNMHKRRHYPQNTIREAAPSFSGLKMYINHPTKSEDRERPERDLRDWAGTIVESRYEDGKAIAKVAIHDNWLRERVADPVAREHIGLSINTSGKISYGNINGQEMQIVEKIILERRNGSASVDWVTEAGARGRVSRLLKENKGVNKMEISEATFEDLQKENPQLVSSITDHVKKSLKEGEAKEEGKDLVEANKKVAELEEKESIRNQKDKISDILKESKLPDLAKGRILESFSSTLFEKEEDLKEAVAGKVKTELEYINSFSNKGKINISGEKEETGIKESLQVELDDRFGFKNKEESDEE